jgi:hypothetical protein
MGQQLYSIVNIEMYSICKFHADADESHYQKIDKYK